MGKAMLHDADHHCAGLYCWAAMGVLLTVTSAAALRRRASTRCSAQIGEHSAQPAVPHSDVFSSFPLRALWRASSIGPTAALVPLTISASRSLPAWLSKSLEEIDAGVVGGEPAYRFGSPALRRT